jgi:hypothetical protein
LLISKKLKGWNADFTNISNCITFHKS